MYCSVMDAEQLSTRSAADIALGLIDGAVLLSVMGVGFFIGMRLSHL